MDVAYLFAFHPYGNNICIHSCIHISWIQSRKSSPFPFLIQKTTILRCWSPKNHGTCWAWEPNMQGKLGTPWRKGWHDLWTILGRYHNGILIPSCDWWTNWEWTKYGQNPECNCKQSFGLSPRAIPPTESEPHSRKLETEAKAKQPLEQRSREETYPLWSNSNLLYASIAYCDSCWGNCAQRVRACHGFPTFLSIILMPRARTMVDTWGIIQKYMLPLRPKFKCSLIRSCYALQWSVARTPSL